jgi:hypothetical protein
MTDTTTNGADVTDAAPPVEETVTSPPLIPSDDPRVLAWQAANNLLSEASQFEAASAEHSSRVALAQVYATLAGVSSEVLTGIQLASLTNHVVKAQAQQVQDQIREDIVGQISPDS